MLSIVVIAILLLAGLGQERMLFSFAMNKQEPPGSGSSRKDCRAFARQRLTVGRRIGKQDQTAMKVAEFALGGQGKSRRDKTTSLGELTFSAVHFPDGASGHNPRLGTGGEIALAECREAQQVITVVAKRDHSILLE